MATLEKIRNKAGLLIAVIGVALFAFIIGDFLNSGSTYWGISREKVGEVAGEKLTIFDFQKDITTTTEVMKIQSQMMQFQQIPSDGEIRDMAWNNFVQRSLLNSEAEKIGLHITPLELRDLTLGENIHPLMRQIPIFYNEQGVFDQNILLNVLSSIDQEEAAQLRDYWLYWERMIKEQALAEKYQTLVGKAIAMTGASVSIVADLDKKEMDIACARKQYYSIPDSTIAVSDKEIQTRYNETKEKFKTDGYRTLRVISFDIVPSQEDYANTEKMIIETQYHLEKITEEELPLFVSQATDPDMPFNPFFRTENDIDAVFKDFAFIAPKGSVADAVLDGDYYKTAKILSNVEMRPDSVKVSHILLQRQTLEETQRVADSLVAELKNGANFASLVQTYSVDEATKPTGGDLGWFREGATMLESFDTTVFVANVGEVVTVPTNRGVHVMKITEKTAPVQKVKIAIVANKVEASTATYRKIYNQANQFILTNTNLESFEAAAKEQGLAVRPLAQLAQNQSSVYMFEQARPVVKWAWENKVGAVSEVFEVPNKFVIAAVSEAIEPGYIPLESASATIKSELQRDKKAEKLISEFSGVTDLETISLIDTIKSMTFSQNSLPGIGRESVVAAAAYATAVNKVSNPLKGNSGVYVLKVLDRRDVASPVELDSEVTRLNNTIRSTVSRGLLESLKKNAQIEDNRFNFY